MFSKNTLLHIAIKTSYIITAGIIMFPEKSLVELAIFSAFLLLSLLPIRKKELDTMPKKIRSNFLVGITLLQIIILSAFTIKNIWNNPTSLYLVATYVLAITFLIINLKLTEDKA